MRTCVVTKEKLPKMELIRIVVNEGNIIVDETGKVNGHGCYLKKDENVVLDREPPLGSDVLLEENKQSVSEELKSQIRNLGQQYGYDMFENVLKMGLRKPSLQSFLMRIAG